LRYRVFSNYGDGGRFEPFIQNIDYNDLVQVNLRTVAALPADGQIIVEFPIFYKSNTVNGVDLYTGLAYRDPVECALYVGGTPDTDAECLLVPGSLTGQNLRPARIEVGNLASGYAGGSDI